MIIKCKMCGGDLAFEESSTVCECEYCGSRQTLPGADSEKKVNLFNRANRLRMNSEFDKACAVYEQIVAEFPEEAEAYWGLCLCNYGIEYVDDPTTGKKLPTCHRTMVTSIMEDANFEQACDNADAVARRVYRDEAKQIDRIQKDILSIASGEAPYDVFICYKETAMEGGRTEDSVLAQDIYDALTARGLKVFFSRITLEDKLGVQYEPYIFAALSSAKVMLAIGTQFEYYDAVWVKNEWSRFLAMMKADKSKALIPCYKDLDAYDMPKEFKGLQAQDMGKLGWLQDLTRGVEKLCGKGQPAVATVVREVIQNGGSNAANLVQRVRLFLQDGDFDQATEYINRTLDVDAKYAPAYVAKVLVQYKLKNEQALTTLRKSIDDNADWQKALRFADAQQKQAYLSYAAGINNNEAYDREQARIAAENKKREEEYDAAVTVMKQNKLYAAIVNFSEIVDFKDSNVLLQKCIDAYRVQLIEEEKCTANQALTAAKQAVRQAQLAVEGAQKQINEAEQGKAEAEIRLQAIAKQISDLSRELSQLRGLFSGGKKRELEGKLETLERERSALESKKQECERLTEAANAELISLRSALQKANEKQTQIETELNNKAPIQWPDEMVISSAREAVIESAAIAPFKKVGNMVTFGHYEQDKNKNNGKEPIEWIVLDVQGNKALLISKYGLDCQRYNEQYTYVTWEKCTLRSWLNSTFLNAAFTSEEQKGILTTAVDNSKAQGYSGYSTNGGNNTRDKIFLLSYAEANKYFGVQPYSVDGAKQNTASRVAPTAYAIAQGAYTNSDYKTSEGMATGYWWLRSPGDYQNYAAYVYTDGSLTYSNVNNSNKAARPAFWLDLESGIY